MRRKIIIGFVAFSVLILASVLGGVIYVDRASSQLQALLRSHQVEILRHHLLEKVETVQSDFYLLNTRYARGINTIVSDVRDMEVFFERCFGCHHAPEAELTLQAIRGQIEGYKGKLSRHLTLRANLSRSQAEEKEAYLEGQQLVALVNKMITHTSSGLREKTEGSLANMEKTRGILFLILLTVPVLMVIFSVTMIPRITRPVKVLRDAIYRLKAGDLNFRIHPPLKEEFGEVASAFNEMTETLKEQMHKMQRAEQMVVCGQLAAGLAHEIKNPLAGIKVALEVLQEELALSTENQATLKAVNGEIRRIELLIKSLLEFARPPKPNFVAVDLRKALETTLDFVSQQSPFRRNPAKSVQIIKDWNGHLPEIQADPQQLQQVFLNLLLNAYEAMADGGVLRVGIRPAPGGWVEVCLSDTGKGIPPENLDRIFQPFFTTKRGGTGLGLAITKQLVEQQGGTLAAGNIPGEGACFQVRIPLPPAERQIP